MLKSKKMDLKQYDQKIYHIRDTFALRFNSGSFHYVSPEVLKEAYKIGFEVGYHKAVYSPSPSGMVHSGYKYEPSEKLDQLFKETYKLN